MKLVDLLKPELVKVGIGATTKEAAIEELIDVLISGGAIAPEQRDAVAHAIFAREKAKSTGMERGVALPHGAVDGLASVAAALGISPGGIDFRSLDKKPAHLIVLLAIPQSMLQFHVKTLAGIARLFADDALRERLRTAPDAAAAFEALREQNGD
jgi:mannitol/fructose-specific phosphotransferase system IIA component (Ntr-type)